VDLEEASAAFVLGSLRCEHLPDVATSALMQGLDSTSLTLLAGESPHQLPADLWDLFLRAIAELGRTLPSRLEAAWYMKHRVADDVSAGRLAPREGAARILSLLHEVDQDLPRGQFVGSSFGVAQLIGDYYCYDDVDPQDPQSIAAIDNALLKEFRRIAADDGTRTL
jgi:hypothetical protein